MKENYPILRSLPVAKFYYKGQSHTHPVRRTVVLIESDRNSLCGYELREGLEVRNFKNAPVKSYDRASIARIKQIDCRRVLRARAEKKELNKSTLARQRLVDMLQTGV